MNTGAYRIDTSFISPNLRKAILSSIEDRHWVRTHPDGPYQSDAWRVITLINKGKPLPALERYPEIAEIAQKFNCKILSMVFYSILPGGVLHRHRDLSGTLEFFGRLRFHVPLATNPSVNFEVSKKTVPMAEGELWALNTSYLHAVSNLGETDRIHLVLEVEANDWCWSLLPKRDIRYYAHSLFFAIVVIGRAIETFLFNRSRIKGQLAMARAMFKPKIRQLLGKQK
jgi:hypothetical protein